MNKLLVVLLVFSLAGCCPPNGTEYHPPICASNGVLYTWSSYYEIYTATETYCIPSENVK